MKSVNLLSKAEMKNVRGGLLDTGGGGGSFTDVCEVLLTYSDGSTKNTVSFWDGAGSGEANVKAECAGHMSGPGAATRCQYDCGSDGFTASWIPRAL